MKIWDSVYVCHNIPFVFSFPGFFTGTERLHPRPGFPVHIDSLLTSSVNITGSSSKSTHVFAESMAPKIKKFYKLPIFPRFSIKIPFDRLALLAVLDRNMTVFENIFSILLAVLVGIFSCMVLEKGYYEDLSLFFFCAVTASCQYSLLKSVQPDSASPTHGINRIIVFSRPVYFVLCCSVALSLEAAAECGECLSAFSFYGVKFPTSEHLRVARDGIYLFILFFPLIFVLGLLPQVNTFSMYVLEQIDIHIFGGNATSSLLSSMFCLGRSLISVGILVSYCQHLHKSHKLKFK